MSFRFPAVLLLASPLVFIAVGPAAAQVSKGTEAARAEVARGKTAFNDAKDYAAARAAFQKAVELDPAWPEAHVLYKTATLYAAGARVAEQGMISAEASAKATGMLRPQYETWIAAHPKTAGYLWALGDILAATDRAKAQDLCTKAIALDRAFMPAYTTLARIAAASGDMAAQVEALRKASEAAPDNPDQLSAYIHALWPRDPAAARTLSLQMADRFPSETVTFQALFDLAAQSNDVTEKIALLERVRRQAGTVQQSAMRYLYGVYIASDPEKALALAKEMAAKTPAGPSAKMWSDAIESASRILRVRSLVADKQFAGALAIAQAGTRSPTGKVMANLNISEPVTDEMTLLAAEAESGLGQRDVAYARAMELFLRQPSDRFRAAVARYGSALGRSPSAVDEDVRARLVATATPAPDFPILTYPDGRKGSLSDLRGKVVLLNFWFPT